MTFRTNPRRDASGTIAGFVYQVDVTILKWLELQPEEGLDLERGEDIDLVQTHAFAGDLTDTRVLEQIKRRSKLSLNSPEALMAVARFNEHRNRKPGQVL